MFCFHRNRVERVRDCSSPRILQQRDVLHYDLFMTEKCIFSPPSECGVLYILLSLQRLSICFSNSALRSDVATTQCYTRLMGVTLAPLYKKSEMNQTIPQLPDNTLASAIVMTVTRGILMQRTTRSPPKMQDLLAQATKKA